MHSGKLFVTHVQLFVDCLQCSNTRLKLKLTLILKLKYH